LPIGNFPAAEAKDGCSSSAKRSRRHRIAVKTCGQSTDSEPERPENTTENAMRLSIDWTTAAGCLAVIATLALSVPGVRVVRADDEAEFVSVSLVDGGPSCEPSSEELPPTTVDVVLKRDPNQAEDSRTIALNNRGYSYRPPAVEPAARSSEYR
jgi:hypothetical protein